MLSRENKIINNKNNNKTHYKDSVWTRRVADILEAFGASDPGSNPGGSVRFTFQSTF